jgi:hypothetical protein
MSSRFVSLQLLAIFILSAAISAAPAVLADSSSSATMDFASQFGRDLFNGAAEPVFDLSRSESPLSGLSISGLLSNTSGMWANSAELTNFGRSSGEHHGANSLAIQRNWMQLDTNYVLNGNNKFFIRFWGVYEPPYPWESNNILSVRQVYGQNQSQFYNQYGVRDAFWKNTSGPLTLFIGRQIVTWGESISFRVGDVINPQDLSWSFGFANLEQSRLPLWMVHPIVNLPKLGPLADNFIEGVWAPAWQPMYTNVDYVDQRYAAQHEVAGAVNLLPPGGARFDTYPYPFTTPAETPRGSQPAFPQVTNLATPIQTYKLPADTWANSVEGFRVHTLVEDAEMTALYWHGHQLNPTMFLNGTPETGQTFQFRYPELNDIGVTLNRPIYLPVGAGSNIPFVVRTEGVWQDRTPFNTLNLARPSAVVYSSTLNTLGALDIDGLAVPWLSRSGALTMNLEWNNYTILSPNKDMVYGGYAERWRHNEESVLLSLSTSWWWGAIVPTPSGIYNPDGNTWEFFPNVVFTPPWTNKYLLMLQYIGVLSDDKYSAYAGGNFKGKNILLMQFQYNFNLVRGRG